MMTIKHRQGDTFSWGGTVTLPGSGTWSAHCAVRNTALAPVLTEPDGWITATLSLVGPNATDPTKNDYAILLYAAALDTVNWANLTALTQTPRFVSVIKFADDAAPPNEVSSEEFTIILSYDIVPQIV